MQLRLKSETEKLKYVIVLDLGLPNVHYVNQFSFRSKVTSKTLGVTVKTGQALISAITIANSIFPRSSDVKCKI